MNGLLGNPLFHIGAGLLANAGPSQVPRGLGPGLISGVQNYMAADQMAQQQAMQRQLAEARMAQLAAEQQEMERRRQQDAARQQAMQAYVASLSPEEGAMMAQFAAMGGDVAGLLGEQMKPPTPTDDMREYEAARAQGFPGSFMDFMTAIRRAGATNVNVGGEAYKPQTGPGKLLADLSYLQTQPPSPERDATIEKIRKDLSTAPEPSAEERRISTRMESVGDIAKEFDRIATQIEEGGGELTGPLAGRITRGKAGFGVGSEEAATLYSMEAQMRALLGTALSGAAIPESEWPTYQAQVPSLQDQPAVRKGKLRAFLPMLRALEERSSRATPSPLGATPAPGLLSTPAIPPPPPGFQVLP